MPGGIRPTQDKVRKAIFDILGDIEGLFFLELFAGSGAVGLEAASRKAKKVILVENNRDCQIAITKNITALKADNCILYSQEVGLSIVRLHQKNEKFNLIFLDPPYTKSLDSFLGDNIDKSNLKLASSGYRISSAFRLHPGSTITDGRNSLSKKTLQMLAAYDILAPDGFIITQHFKKDNLPESLGELILEKRNRYGDTYLSFYKKIV
jgi:16S rRNA (guanine966-N2)-methyltransferase